MSSVESKRRSSQFDTEIDSMESEFVIVPKGIQEPFENAEENQPQIHPQMSLPTNSSVKQLRSSDENLASCSAKLGETDSNYSVDTENDRDGGSLESRRDCESLENHQDAESLENHIDEESLKNHIDEESLENHIDEESLENHIDEESLDCHQDEESLESHQDEESPDCHQDEYHHESFCTALKALLPPRLQLIMSFMFACALLYKFPAFCICWYLTLILSEHVLPRRCLPSRIAQCFLYFYVMDRTLALGSWPRAGEIFWLKRRLGIVNETFKEMNTPDFTDSTTLCLMRMEMSLGKLLVSPDLNMTTSGVSVIATRRHNILSYCINPFFTLWCYYLADVYGLVATPFIIAMICVNTVVLQVFEIISTRGCP